jgi:deoxyhypusine monooxygenase
MLDINSLSQSDYDNLQKSLEDTSLTMEKRLRSVFTLKSLKTNEAVEALKGSLNDPSVLLAHEVAYVMGQMQNAHATPYLVNTLCNESIHPMVRHEAAEALGALGQESSLPVLEEYSKHTIPEVRDTCLIAVDLLQWKQQNKEDSSANAFHPMYGSVDPAPPSDLKEKPNSSPESLQKLRETLLNKELSIFERYRAMFCLRNIGITDAVNILVEAIDNSDDEGAVFAHEVAYVLGQIQHPAAIDGLKKLLLNTNLNCMVRHEAAESLGAVANEEVCQVLKEFTNDNSLPVSQSCAVALDIYEYNNSDQFQYADGLVKDI